MITEAKWQQLRHRMAQLKLEEQDIEEKFILGSGSGGQKINKTASCVWIKHLPSSIIIKCQSSRYRESNRFLARRRLCDRYETLVLNQKSTQQKAIEKLKRQKRKRSKRAKAKILADKAHRAGVKKLRQRPE